MGFWWRPLSVLASVLLVALILRAASGWVAALGFLAGIQAFVMLRRLWQEFRLARWLENPDEVEPPDATGTWGDIFYRLQKLQKRQKASRGQLTSALEQFEHAAMAVPDGMVILNGNEQIDWCNPASRTYMGLDCERDRGQFIRYLLRQAHFLEFLDAADFSRRLVCKSPINREITLSLQLVPFDEGKKLLVARDITDLERVDAMRRDFIANVSHELRTPMSIVRSSLDNLEQEGLSDAQRVYLVRAQGGAERLQGILSALGAAARVEESIRQAERIPFDLKALIQSAVAGYRDAFSGSLFDLDLPGDPCHWRGAPELVVQMLDKLVENAVDFTPAAGRIGISLRRYAGNFEIAVTNDGPVIPEELLPRLFESLFELRETPGERPHFGLGLYIVRLIAEFHGGKAIVANRADGGGVTFSVSLPMI